MSEKQTRINLIDKELNSCGWDVNDISKVIQEYEIEFDNSTHNLPPFFDTTKRFADYVLLNKQGDIIAVVEAKTQTKSISTAQTQAEYYAQRIQHKQGFMPLIYITNGLEIEFWDSENYPIRKVLSYHSLEDLETYRKRANNHIKLSTELLNKDIVNRHYQINAITKTIENLNDSHRSILWVMATGTGKTRTIIALIDILLRAGFIKRVLFLADRKELVNQAIGDFKEYLPNDPRQKIQTDKFDKTKRIYVSTFQTMMSLIQNKDISQGFFDLIVADESHRSIYNYYGQVFLKFDCLKIGLTATPVSFENRDTYKFFGTEDSNPTFAYTYEEALKDNYLSSYDVVSVKTDFLQNGIKFGSLPKEEQEKLLAQEYEASQIDFEGTAIEKMVKNDDTNRLILTTLMQDGYKDPTTNLLAKTIIFAINRPHANRLVKLFDELYPQYKSKVAKVITSDLNNADELIKEFKDKFENNKSKFNIAVSVGMLDTGIDVPSIMNLVFAKPVFSRAKFWQMIGRGTRLYNNKFKKEKFVIFDFWDNFEYFNEQPSGEKPQEQISLHRKIFEQNLELLRSLKDDEYNTIKDELKKQISKLPLDDFFIKQNKSLLEPFLNDFDTNTSRLDTISELFDRIVVQNYNELRFRLQTKKLQTYKAIQDDEKLQRSIENIVTDILRLPLSLTQIKEQEELILKASDGTFWLELDFVQTNATTNLLAPLMQYKSKKDIQEYHFDLKDHIKSKTNIKINHPSINLKAYEENILRIVQKLINDSPALQQLFIGVPLTDKDIEKLKDDLLKEDIEADNLSKVFKYKSDDLRYILEHITQRKEYKLPFLLNKFIQTHTLNTNQIEFINAIKHYIEEKHDITRKDLTQNPFTKFHKMGIVGMFAGSLMTELVEIIDDEVEV